MDCERIWDDLTRFRIQFWPELLDRLFKQWNILNPTTQQTMFLKPWKLFNLVSASKKGPAECAERLNKVGPGLQIRAPALLGPRWATGPLGSSLSPEI